MVAKLMKHDLIAIFRVLGFFMIGAAVFGILGRILLAVSVVKEGAFGVSLLFLLFYIFAVCALVVAAYAIAITRFYKTLFSGEGYLTLSLPASPAQIVWSKLLSSLIAVVASGVVSGLTVSLFFIGWNEAITEEFRMLFEMIIGDPEVQLFFSDPLTVIEVVIEGILALPLPLLLVDAGLCIGQLFSRHRKLFLFLVFIGGYIALSLLYNLGLTPILEAADTVSSHLSGWIAITLSAAVDVGCFLFIRYILKCKVNLSV